ncbi:MAG: two component transcriptional regulator, Fis family [Myxococcales bacterium]|nr:two component transcriptional regulator, Fis family [Myxococcales bacterium]
MPRSNGAECASPVSTYHPLNRERILAILDGMVHATRLESESGRPVEVVLAVDDDERLLAAYTRGLDPARRVLTASSTEVALRLAREKAPDLAVVDMRLGTSSGIDLIRELRRVRPEMTIVLCSAYMSVVAAVDAVRAGADEIMTKPLTLKEVIRRVEEGTAEKPTSEETPTLARVEWEHIMRVLGDCDGNLSEAARRLGIYRSTLKRRLRKYAPD